MSERISAGLPKPCSGEIYLGVPIIVPTMVASLLPADEATLASPKSMTLILASLILTSTKAMLSLVSGLRLDAMSELENEIIILAGLTSRWTTCSGLSQAALRALATAMPI